MVKRLSRRLGAACLLALAGLGLVLVDATVPAKEAWAQSMELVQYEVGTEFIGCTAKCCWTNYCCSAWLDDCTAVIVPG